MPAWTPDGKFKLLLAVITDIAPNATPNWDQVALLMGPEYTREAVRQQFKKIKTSASSELNVDGNAAASPAKAIPRKRKAPEASNGPADTGDYDEEEKTTPIKKRVKSVKKEEAEA
ncbi:MAG: hypothetical protein M1828_002474 [Chrysothrix sp. TS-e1954]|nr:MAG: hypothetical protein M1828_002474 [Chrysothrix sp. TS-e1954]